MFSVAVMMHPTREKYKDYLISKLGNVPIIMDEGEGLWHTARRAWLSYDKKKDFHLVIQDDAIICKDFYARLEKVIVSGEFAYNLYFGSRKNKTLMSGAKKGLEKGFLIRSWLVWAVGIVLPTKLIPEMIEYCDKLKMNNDDTKIAKFLQMKNIKTYYPLPSLLDHRQDEISLVENRNSKGRKALYFIDNYDTKNNSSSLDRGKTSTA